MKVLLYTEGYKTISKSGLGKAIKHQMQALEDNNIEYTTNLKDDFDILHVNFYGPKSYLFTKKMRKKGKKIIYHAHSTEEDFRNSFLFSNLVSPLFKKWICTCYKLGDIIITPTEYSKKLLENYHLDRPIKAISNGVDTKFFEHNDTDGKKFRKHYGYKPSDKVIVGIGLYIERKGILDFVELAKRLPEYKFIWFGYSPLWASPRKIRKAVNTKLDNLTFAGYVDSSMIKSALSGANLYLFPTLEETEGIPIIEALSSKIPTLIRDIPIFEEYPNDAVYKARNVDEFEEKIKLILEGKLPNLTNNGYKLAKKKDLKVVGEELAKTYKEVLKVERKEEKKEDKISSLRNLGLLLMSFLMIIFVLIKANNFVEIKNIKEYREKIQNKEKNKNTKEYTKNIVYLDSNISIKFYTDSESNALRAEEEIETIYSEYDKLTDYDNKDSELYKINHNTSKDKELTIDHKLYSLIKYGIECYDKTDGLVNINNGEAIALWKKYKKENKGIPSTKELKKINNDIKNIVLLDNERIKNNHPNINLDSIRVGYVTERVVDTLKLLGIDNYIITAGNIIVTGNNINNDKYTVLIEKPFKGDSGTLTTLRVTNKVIVTKALYQNYYHYQNKDYSMMINPKTKEPANEMVSVTVVGNDISDTNMYANMLFMLSIEKGQDIVDKNNDLEALWGYVYDNNLNDYVISENFYQS